MDLLEQVRTLRKAWARAIELSVEAIDSRQIERLAVVYVRAESEAEKFFQQFNESINYPGEVL
ncbi:MAG: hypothetical protein IMY85_00835 [Chloroflexi bacterium]|nr:hypothetical protein [Chloroflexota bacterium]